VSTEAEELHRIISASVRDMLDAYRIQASAGPVSDKAPGRSSSGRNMASSRVPRLPSVVRILLTTFLEEVAGRAARSMSRAGLASEPGMIHATRRRWWDQLVRSPPALTIAWRGRRLGMNGTRRTTLQ